MLLGSRPVLLWTAAVAVANAVVGDGNGSGSGHGQGGRYRASNAPRLGGAP